jgi:hypothetical protein
VYIYELCLRMLPMKNSISNAVQKKAVFLDSLLYFY